MLGNGRAIDLHERSVAPPAEAVERGGDELFPAATLPANEHARVGLGDLADRGQQGTRGLGVAEDALLAGAKVVYLPPQRGVLETVLHRLYEPLAADRLFEKIVHAEPHRFNCL